MSVLAHEGTYPILYGSYAVPVGSGHAPGYLARPDQAGRFPGVLVLPDGRLRSFHRELCRRLARHGLAALAVGLPSELESAVAHVAEAHEFLMSADVTWVIEHHLGIVGLGTGGGPGLLYAADHAEVRAVGLVSTILDEAGPVASVLERLAVPVFGLYATTEVSGSEVDDGRLPNGSFVVYAGVSGGFLDDGAPSYDSSASADAGRRLIDFLTRTLPPPETPRLG